MRAGKWQQLKDKLVPPLEKKLPRDPERIDRILAHVSSIWHTYPDLRLCQLIGNTSPTPTSNYNMEDDTLERKLHEIYDPLGIRHNS